MSNELSTAKNHELLRDNNQHLGGLFYGIVSSVSPGTFNVEINPKDQRQHGIVQGICLSSCLSHLLGIKESYLPPIGSEVLCYPHAPFMCVVLGIIPKADVQNESGWYPARSVFGAGDGNADAANIYDFFKSTSKNVLLNNTRPTDVAEGEYVLSNEFGVLLGLFQQFATLKASELAQVQAFVLDDLVRIVSHNFQHFTCLGEHKVFHDGNGLHVEFGATHDPKEAMGRAQTIGDNTPTIVEDPSNPTVDDAHNFVKLEDERLTSISRFRGFIGALSDFVNLMIVRPADRDKLTDGVKPTEPDRGLFNVHVSTDGSFAMRSLGGIYLEKTNWIRVPERVRDPEDPKGDDASQIEYKSKEAFEFDPAIKAKGQPFLYFLQLRDYLAFLQEDLAYRNFKQHEKDFYLNDDFTKETNLNETGNVHVRLKTKYEPRTSGMYMMPNGGVMFRDAWGSALVMEGGNIYLQAAKDIVHQPMRHMIGKIGGNISLEAKEDIDLSSYSGGFRLKTDKAQYLYSHKSGILLHSNTEFKSGDYVPDPATAPIEKLCGIVFLSPNSGIYSYANESYARTKNQTLIYSDRVVVEAERWLHIISRSNLALYSQNSTLLTSDASLIATSRNSLIAFGDKSTVIGKEGQTHAVAIGGSVEGFLKPDQVDPLLTQLDEISAYKVKELTSNFREDNKYTDLKFKFLSSAGYGINPSEDMLPQTIKQQEDIIFKEANLKEWKEEAINDTYPFPGKDMENSYITYELQNLEVKEKELVNKVVDLKRQAVLTSGLNLFTDYKVYGRQ